MITWNVADTPIELKQCYQLRAEEYRRCYCNIPEGEFVDDWDGSLMPDGSPQSFSILVRDSHKVIGTARLVISDYPRSPGVRSEIASLMDFDLGKVLGLAGVNGDLSRRSSYIGEIGKLAISRGVAKDAVMRLIFGKIAEVAQPKGTEVLLAIMRPPLAWLLQKIGYNFRPIEAARLRRETLDELKYITKFYDYFLPSLKARHPRVADDAFLRSATLDALNTLVRECEDGPRLYWIETSEYLRVAGVR